MLSEQYWLEQYRIIGVCLFGTICIVLSEGTYTSTIHYDIYQEKALLPINLLGNLKGSLVKISEDLEISGN